MPLSRPLAGGSISVGGITHFLSSGGENGLLGPQRGVESINPRPKEALPLLCDPGGDPGPRREPQLFQDLVYVVLYGTLGDRELLRDLTVG